MLFNTTSPSALLRVVSCPSHGQNLHAHCTSLRGCRQTNYCGSTTPTSHTPADRLASVQCRHQALVLRRQQTEPTCVCARGRQAGGCGYNIPTCPSPRLSLATATAPKVLPCYPLLCVHQETRVQANGHARVRTRLPHIPPRHVSASHSAAPEPRQASQCAHARRSVQGLQGGAPHPPGVKSTVHTIAHTCTLVRVLPACSPSQQKKTPAC